MCNLYSITTNQEAIRALLNRYFGNLAPMPGVFPHYPARSFQTRAPNGSSPDALGHAAIAAHGRPTGHEHPQHVITAPTRLAEAGEPMSGPGQRLRRVRTGAEPGDKEKGRGQVRTER